MTGPLRPSTLPRVLAATAMIALLSATPAVAQDAQPAAISPIGNAIQIVREVTGEIEAQFRYLLREDPVFPNEVIETQPESASRIIFQDRTELSVGPGARITLDEFVFDPDPSLARFVLSAFDGVFRFKSGKLAKTAYAIETPTAVIGVRGTVFSSVFGPGGQYAIVLESRGDAVTVRPIGGCDSGTESILSTRGSAVVIDGCEVSEPGPPPQWAIEQIAALNALLFELNLQFDVGPDNDSDTPIQQDAAIPPGEITIQPASAPAVEDVSDGDGPDPTPSNDRGNSQPGNTHSGNGTGNGKGNGGNSTAGNNHSGSGAAANNSGNRSQAGNSNKGGKGRGR